MYAPHHRCLAWILALFAGLTPLACQGHDVRDLADRVHIVQAESARTPQPIGSTSTECNESGCMCKGATLCQFASADAWQPIPVAICECISDRTITADVAGAYSCRIEAESAPAPIAGKMLRAWCASWLL